MIYLILKNRVLLSIKSEVISVFISLETLIDWVYIIKGGTMETYRVYAENLITKHRRFITEAEEVDPRVCGVAPISSLISLYAQECKSQEKIILVSKKISEAAALLGKKGGSVSSEAKTLANRAKGEFGKLGGRPRKDRSI